MSVLSLNWLEVYEEQKTNSANRDFSDNPSPPRAYTHKEVRWLLCTPFKEMSPWESFKSARQYKYDNTHTQTQIQAHNLANRYSRNRHL